jgi:crossover junction endodeoxyribonuclease RuvC
MTILGVDPSVRCSGYALIEGTREKDLRVIDYGSLPQPARSAQADALFQLARKLEDLISTHDPEVVAMEKIIYVQSIRTAISMGSARGAVLVAAGKFGLPVSEYPAKQIKQAATGHGAARKHQMAFMMRALFGLRETPQSDAADALAVALTHFRQSLKRASMGS